MYGTVIFLATVRDSVTPTTIYAKDEQMAVALPAQVGIWRQEGKAAFVVPLPYNIGVTPIATTTATVRWTTGEPVTSSYVEWGATTGLGGSQVSVPASGVGNFSANLTGLTTGTLYYYRVLVASGANDTRTDLYTFTTA